MNQNEGELSKSYTKTCPHNNNNNNNGCGVQKDFVRIIIKFDRASHYMGEGWYIMFIYFDRNVRIGLNRQIYNKNPLLFFHTT